MSIQCQKNNPDSNGKCCCNCQKLLRVMCHPSNRKIGRGPISKIFGFACIALDIEDGKWPIGKVDFFESMHGLCECWTKGKDMNIVMMTDRLCQKE